MPTNHLQQKQKDFELGDLITILAFRLDPYIAD